MADVGSAQRDRVAIAPCAESSGARLSRVGRLWLLESVGDAGARGRQHGALLADIIHLGVVPFLAQRAFDLPDMRRAAPSAKQAMSTLVAGIYADIESAISAHQRAELQGIAEGGGLPYGDVFRASFLSEALQALASVMAGGRSAAAAHGACTAAVVVGARGAGGGSIHGKNQDYDGGGLWDRYPLVHAAEATEGLAHISATSVGLIKGNLTLNAAGVSIGGHFLFSTAAGSTGQGFTTLEREVALHARSVADAVDILRAGPVRGSFAFVVSDPREALVAECDGDGARLRPAEDGWLGMSNLMLQNDASDLLVRWGAHRNPLSRQRRVDACGRDAPQVADAQHIAAILSDRVDVASNATRGPAHVIAHATTVTSAIADTGRLAFWVGEATCPASDGSFVGFDCGAWFGKTGGISVCGAFNASGALEATRSRAFRMFLGARDAFTAGDGDVAQRLLTAAAAEDGDEPAYPRFLARLAIRGGDAGLALSYLKASVAMRQGANERAECSLLMGWAQDLAGERIEACAAYSAVIAASQAPMHGDLDWINPRLVSAARGGLAAPFGADAAAQIEMRFDLTSGWE